CKWKASTTNHSQVSAHGIGRYLRRGIMARIGIRTHPHAAGSWEAVSNAGKFQGLPAGAKAGKDSSKGWQTDYACGRKAGDPKSVAWGSIDHRTMRAIQMHRNGPAIMRAMVMRIAVLPTR